MLENLSKKISNSPVIVITAILLLTIFFAIQAKQNLFDEKNSLIIDSSVEPLISRDSGSYDFFIKTKEIFGSEDIIVIALEQTNKDRYTLDFLNRLNSFEEDLKKIRGVESTNSILSSSSPKKECSHKSYFYKMSGDSICQSIIEIANLNLECIKTQDYSLEEEAEDDFLEEDYEEDDQDLGDESFICTKEIASISKESELKRVNSELKELIEEIKKDSFFLKDLISNKKDVTAITVKFRLGITASDEDIQKNIKNIISKYKSNDLNIYYAGKPRDEYESSKILESDVEKILPLSILLMAIVLFLLFRNMRGVLIPISIVLIGIIWTFGFFAFMGGTLNLVIMILPPLLVAVGSAYIIHVLNHYNHELLSSNNIKKIISKTIESISLPLLITGFTTIAGFAALLLSPVPAIKEMGIYACFGIASVVLLSLVFAPAVLSLLPISKVVLEKENIVDSFLIYKSKLVEKYSKNFIVAWIVIVIIAIVGMSNITFDSKSSFNKDLQIVKDLDFIEKSLAGTSYLKVILEGDSLETAKTIYGINAVKKFLNNLEIDDLQIDKIYSVVEYLEYDRNGLDNLKDKEVVNFFKDLQKEKEIKFLSDDKRYMQFYLRMTTKGTNSFLELRKQLNEQLKISLPNLKSRLTGSAILTSESADDISKGQLNSVLMAIVIIFVVLSLLFLSFKMGFLAIYPNIAAIAIFFGMLGWLNIPIGVTVSVIGAIALGIGVDDTIHFLSHYNKEVKKSRDEKKSVVKTLRLIGRPMIYTTITLTLGFIVFGLSDMQSQVMFGILTTITLIICLITDLNFLPSIMSETKLITVWDYMDLEFNEKFIRSIKIFDGLTLNETKFTTLMAYTQDLKKDEILFKEGQSGNEMYIVLKGRLELYLDEELHNQKQVLTEVAKGKSFGEMALFRNENRVASARAIVDTQLLVLNDKVLNDLQKRYPKIASRFFFNLAKDLIGKIKDKKELVKLDEYENIITENSPIESSSFGYKTICSLANTLQKQNKLEYS